MATLDTPDIKTKDKADLDAVWNVVVHNDPVNLMSYVLVFPAKKPNAT